MAETSDTGVIGPSGEVHNYPGLFVIDGAALPAATGVNPSHTIAAVAERNVELFIRGLPGKAGWHSPQFAENAGGRSVVIDRCSRGRNQADPNVVHRNPVHPEP